jgi:hypothetical protein
VASAVLVDLARVPLDDDLVHQHLGHCAYQQQIGPLRSVLPLMTCFIPSFMHLGIVPAVVSAVFSRALLTMLRRVSRVSRALRALSTKLSLDRTIGLFIGFLHRSDGLSAVAGGQCRQRSFPQPQDRTCVSVSSSE